jgi:hypothetical protein
MRISEEKDRVSREQAVLSRLDGALDEMVKILGECVTTFNEGFEADVRLERAAHSISVDVAGDVVTLSTDTALPGFQVTHGENRFPIVVGVLPGKNLFYRDPVADKYLTMEDVTKKILDRAMFPKLPE